MSSALRYHCDGCGLVKASSNHWWTARVRQTEQARKLEIAPWDDAVAREPDVEHLCGRACAVERLSKFMEAWS